MDVRACVGLLLLCCACGGGDDAGTPAGPSDVPGDNDLCGPGYDGSYACTTDDFTFEATANGEPMVAEWTTVLVLSDVFVAGSTDRDPERGFAISLSFPREAGPELACDHEDVELKVSVFDPENGRHATSRLDGGGCTIRLTRAGTVLEGFFEGKAVAYEGEETWDIVDGHFQIELPVE